MNLGFDDFSTPERALRDTAPEATIRLYAGEDAPTDVAAGAEWGRERTVRAALLAQRLTGSEPSPEIHLTGLRISGRLDLAGTRFGRLGLRDCWLEEPVTLTDARCDRVAFAGCRLPALDARRLRVDGDLDCARLVAEGKVDLGGASVGRDLVFSGARLRNRPGIALDAEGVAVGRDLRCDEGFSAEGTIRLGGTKVGRRVRLGGGTVLTAAGIPLDLEELRPRLLPGAGEEVQQRTKQARRRDALRFTGVVLAEAFPLFLAVVVALISAVAARRGIRLPGDTLAEQLAGIVWFAFATGATSMAVIEAAKRLFGLRGLYQHRQVRMWLMDRSPSEPAGRDAYRQLLAALGVVAPGSGSRELLRRRHLRRLFNLPIEQVAGQVRSAADLAIVNPRGYGYLLVALAGTYDIEAGPEGSDADAESSVELQLAHAVNSGVDALQIAVGEGWRRYVRSTAVLASGLLGLALARFADLDPGAVGVYVLAALLLGGFLAWFLRDVTAVVERWRR